jgi:hypothetical protein
VILRPSYRGGWGLPDGRSLTAPIVPGGSQVTLRIAARLAGEGTTRRELEVLAGDTHLASYPLEDSDWREQSFGPLPWPPGQPLVLRLPAATEPSGLPQVIVDRIELTWP